MYYQGQNGVCPPKKDTAGLGHCLGTYIMIEKRVPSWFQNFGIDLVPNYHDIPIADSKTLLVVVRILSPDPEGSETKNGG